MEGKLWQQMLRWRAVVIHFFRAGLDNLPLDLVLVMASAGPPGRRRAAGPPEHISKKRKNAKMEQHFK